MGPVGDFLDPGVNILIPMFFLGFCATKNIALPPGFTFHTCASKASAIFARCCAAATSVAAFRQWGHSGLVTMGPDGPEGMDFLFWHGTFIA